MAETESPHADKDLPSSSREEGSPVQVQAGSLTRRINTAWAK